MLKDKIIGLKQSRGSCSADPFKERRWGPYVFLNAGRAGILLRKSGRPADSVAALRVALPQSYGHQFEFWEWDENSTIYAVSVMVN